MVNTLSTLHGALTGERMGNYVHKAEQTIPWDLKKLQTDVGGLIKNVKPGIELHQPQAQPKEKQVKKRTQKKEESNISILKKRYATGAITEEQYIRMKKELEN